MRPLPKIHATAIFALACAFARMAGAADGADAPGTRPVNIVIALFDSLRADHLGCYGYTRPTSPTMDRLAREGLVFDRAYAPSSYTRESVSSLFTGRYPGAGGHTGWQAEPRDSHQTLAAWLKVRSYRTGLFTSSFMIGGQGFRQGFDTQEYNGNVLTPSGQGPALSEKALAFARAGTDAPFFLYLHYLDPHGPYDPPADVLARFTDTRPEKPLHLYKDITENFARLRTAGFGPGEIQFEHLVARYDAEIAHSDLALGLLLDGLRASGALDNSLIIITSDHGEEFLDHGWLDHGWTLYEESIRVPLILWAPGLIAPGRVATPVSLVDVFPTLATLAGAPLAPEKTDGAPLLAWRGDKLEPAELPAPRPILAELGVHFRGLARAIVLGDWKYVAWRKWLDLPEREAASRSASAQAGLYKSGKVAPLDPWAPPAREELFNLAEDPEEQLELSAENFEQFAEMRRLLGAMRTQQEAARTQSTPTPTGRELTDEEKKQMETLGYL